MRPGALKRKNCPSLPDEVCYRHEPFAPVGGSFHGGRLGCDSLVRDWRSTRDRPSVMEWARSNGYIVFTHDLDFGAILAATRASSARTTSAGGPDLRSPTCATASSPKATTSSARTTSSPAPRTTSPTCCPTRSFCYVDDLVDGLVRLMNSPDDFTVQSARAALPRFF